MPSAFSWPMSVPSALRAPAPVNQGVGPHPSPIGTNNAPQELEQMETRFFARWTTVFCAANG